MPDRPNFLIFMTEQHRGDCLGLDGHPCLLTPNMDGIGARGAHFRSTYSTCPTCIAARRSCLSGQFPSTHGMVGYHDGIEWNAPPTMPGTLREAGYQTVWIGRSMHQTPSRKRYGFDHLVQHEEYFDWLEEHAPAGSGGRFEAGPMHNDWTARPRHTEDRLHSTNWILNRALQFLEKRDPSCPFFLVVSFLAAHPPLLPPEFYMNRYLEMDLPEPIIGDWESEPPESWRTGGAGGQDVNLTGEEIRACRAGYYGMINHVDDQLRRILNPVQGIDRMTEGNTVVMFTSDHGEMLGDHYRYHKIMPYEPAARIPLLMRAPRRFGIEAGTVRDEAVCLEDVMPTVLYMADVEIPDTVEGRSLLSLARDEDSEWREFLPIEHSPRHQSLTDGREKFIWFTQDGREQFFHLAEDPEERHDLIDHPDWQDRIDLWRQRLIEHLADRPEGFSDGEKLIPGQRHSALLPGCDSNVVA